MKATMHVMPSLACAGIFLASMPSIARSQSTIDRIGAIAEASSCARVDWADRGRAPKAYMRGMALVYARAVCQPERADVAVVSSARAATGPVANKKDALTWYESKFAAVGMSNATNGVDTLRHAYTLLIGLGMRESSGRHCVGRDLSADFTTANSAEAGLFQTSFGARTQHPTLSALYQQYKADPSGCMLETFSKGVSCKASDAKNHGVGEGVLWQQLTKSCPAFSAEYAAVLMRVHGGSQGEFGPLRKKKAEVIPACDTMLKQVEDLVRSNPAMCSDL
ncbi:MAG: hypothetical protein ACTHOH_07555 [Lysobacteraceae bacterium]